ncbi:hypothetical protein RFI_36665 [Reticulomyxa filosa]|uniref:Uncharacterized protein n=1 Tax=Reticulomyxa filosa TaxID=46433 RepID=X6LJ79_RETFI|nr:hypothetical protein RFI_36665 [Reticulomyxa filosa]|eukprot:ETO00775.1 hypothetical protein RFI_36665 [Reticulomyxa filosa]
MYLRKWKKKMKKKNKKEMKKKKKEKRKKEKGKKKMKKKKFDNYERRLIAPIVYLRVFGLWSYVVFDNLLLQRRRTSIWGQYWRGKSSRMNRTLSMVASKQWDSSLLEWS